LTIVTLASKLTLNLFVFSTNNVNRRLLWPKNKTKNKHKAKIKLKAKKRD